jgi:hypothetical protein
VVSVMQVGGEKRSQPSIQYPEGQESSRRGP